MAIKHFDINEDSILSTIGFRKAFFYLLLILFSGLAFAVLRILRF